MNRESVFAQQLKELVTLAKEQGNVVSREQIAQTFPEFQNDEEKMELIGTYLQSQKIGIGEPVDPFLYLSEEEKDYLAEYLKEVDLLPELSAGEIEGISIAAMAGEIDAQKQLAEVYLKKVPDIAKLYVGQGVLMEDLIGEGNLAVATGVTMLGCLEKHEEVEGLLMQMMMNAMEDAVREVNGTMDTSEKIAEKCNDVLEKAKELAESLGRNVTVEELCMETDYTMEEIYEAVELSGNQIEFIEISK